MGAHFAKSKTVHSFSELSQDSAKALIDDIVAVFHYYCTGRIVLNSGETDEIQAVDVVGTEKYQLPTIPKSTLKNVDKCKDYFLKFVLDILETGTWVKMKKQVNLMIGPFSSFQYYLKVDLLNTSMLQCIRIH